MTPEYLLENCTDKKVMISASKDKNLRREIECRSSFMDDFGFTGIPLKIRCLALAAGYSRANYPKCACGKPVTWKKSTTDGFSEFCSPACSRTREVLSPDVLKILQDVEKMRDMRFVEKMSMDDMAESIGCSAPTVKKWIAAHGFADVRYNESIPETMAKLRDAEWLERRHKTDGAKLEDIAVEIGSSKATLSVYLAMHGIEANDPNSYDRGPGGMSLQSMEVADFIRGLGFESQLSVRKILKAREIDIVVESAKLCIEFNGLYSHVNRPELGSAAQRKGREYHLDKTDRINAAGYKLFHIFSDDWINRRAIVESMIRSKLGVLDRIMARKCKVMPVPPREAKNFLDANHLQGGRAGSSVAYGLYHAGELVSIMTFGRSRFNKNYDHELIRFASLVNVSVVGGFSKLLKHFRDNHSGSIISYADKTHSSGSVYAVNGFRHVKDNPPGYYYVDKAYAKRLHRYAFVKKKIAPGDPRPEWMIMEEKGYRRLWDCGTMVFVLT